MENADARAIMAVLANAHASEVYRLLPVSSADPGLGTIEIARLLSLPQSTVSRHLSALVGVSLARKVRAGRVVGYSRCTEPLDRLERALRAWRR